MINIATLCRINKNVVAAFFMSYFGTNKEKVKYYIRNSREELILPRGKREYSNSGIYHVVSRGNRQTNLYEDDEDYIAFLTILLTAKKMFEEENVQFFAYVLMSNHFHIQLKAPDKLISPVMKFIKQRYAQYYNHKYQTRGNVFDDRFYSKPVEDDEYFKEVLKYILNNPVRAAACDEAAGFKWSSYASLFPEDVKDNDPILEKINTMLISYTEPLSRFSSIESAKEYINDGIIQDRAQFEARRNHNTPQKVIDGIIIKIKKKLGLTSHKDLVGDERKIFLRMFKKAGISLSAICRNTGYPMAIVRDA